MLKTKNGKTILVDSLESTKGMYLEDGGELHYNSYSHELVKEELRVKSVKNISIKFNKKYTTQKNIDKIVFSDIILDYEDYISYTNQSKFKNRLKLEIKL